MPAVPRVITPQTSDSRAGGDEVANIDGTRLLTRTFAGVLLASLLAFTLENLLRTIVPKVVLDRGGDAFVVGLVVAAYSVPSILLRPAIGRLVDGRALSAMLRIGSLTVALAPLGMALPGVVLLAVVRLVHGTGWAISSVANQTLMARVIPVARRGQAAAYYMAMPAISTLIGPALGIALYARFSLAGPIVASGAIGAVTLGVVLWLRVPQARPRAAPPEHGRADAVLLTGSSARPTHRPGTRIRLMDRFLEASALPVTSMIATFMAANSLFIVFPPLYASVFGVALDGLAGYYLAFGLASAVAQIGLARALDHLSRAAAITIGSSIAGAGLLLAAVEQGLLVLVAAGLAYGIGMAFVAPATNALAMDRAAPGKLGSALATYSLGYQLSSGLSGVAWGTIIGIFGFGAAFTAAAGCQAATILLAWRYARNDRYGSS